MGYNEGKVSHSGQTYTEDAFRIGTCNLDDDWKSCSGGCNDYKAGGHCSNNVDARCNAGEGVKITIKCSGGSTKTSSCTGNDE